MAGILSIDELNTLSPAQEKKSTNKPTSARRAIPYEEYFGQMRLTKEQKEKRKQFAMEFEEIMLFIFALYVAMEEYGRLNEQGIIGRLQEKYIDLAGKYTDVDDYLKDHANGFAKQVIETTAQHGEDDYYTSQDRAMYISENEANATLNYSLYAEMMAKGYSKKRWVTEGDDRVRDTHREVDLETIPITDAFVVGDSLMRFPTDTYYGAPPEEICGCRCTIEYYR